MRARLEHHRNLHEEFKEETKTRSQVGMEGRAGEVACIPFESYEKNLKNLLLIGLPLGSIYLAPGDSVYVVV